MKKYYNFRLTDENIIFETTNEHTYKCPEKQIFIYDNYRGKWNGINSIVDKIANNITTDENESPYHKYFVNIINNEKNVSIWVNGYEGTTSDVIIVRGKYFKNQTEMRKYLMENVDWNMKYKIVDYD